MMPLFLAMAPPHSSLAEKFIIAAMMFVLAGAVAGAWRGGNAGIWTAGAAVAICAAILAGR